MEKDCGASPADKEQSTSSSTKKVGDNNSTISDIENVDHVGKNFRETAKYSDTASYASQHHHSVGTGLYLTDEIKDLPPRFRDKVIKALEAGAALNNIPLDRIPRNIFSSDYDESNTDEKDFDSLIVHSPVSLEVVSKSSENEKNPKVPFRRESNARKNCNTFQHSNLNISSNSIQQDRVPICENINSVLPVSNDFKKNKTHLKSESHISTHNARDKRHRVNYHQEKLALHSNVKKASHFVQKSSDSQSYNCTGTPQPHFKIHPKYSSINSVPQRSNGDIVKLDRTESELKKTKTNSSEYNVIHSGRTFTRSQIAINSGESKFSKNRNLIEKQHTGYHEGSYKCNKNFNDKSFACKESCHSERTNISTIKGETSTGRNLSGKRTAFQKEVKGKNHSEVTSASSCSSLISYYDKDISNGKIVVPNKDPSYKKCKNVGTLKDSLNIVCSPLDSSVSHNKPAYRNYKTNIGHSSKVLKNPMHKSSFSDSSSQVSDTSEKWQNSTSLVHNPSNNNSHNGFSGRQDEKLNSRKGKFSHNSNFSPKSYVPEGLKFDIKANSQKELSHTNENRRSNSQQSNYSQRRNKYNYREVNNFGKNTVMKNDQNLESFSLEKRNRYGKNDRGGIEIGFFIKMEVSEEARNLEYWVNILRTVFPFKFDMERCCHFSDILILEFDRKEQALQASKILHYQKKKLQNSKLPYIINISSLITRLIKPCNCKSDVIDDSVNNINKHAGISLSIVNKKVEEIRKLKPQMKRNNVAETEMLRAFEDSTSNFLSIKEDILMKINDAENLKTIQQLKFSFLRECNAFKRCLPIYSKKKEIMDSVRFYPVSVIVAETGSGKSTQLVEYILHTDISNYGLIICTQPRKLAAISIAQFVSGQIGSAVGKIVGYDVGVDRKYSEVTKIIFMTDYCLLKKYLRNPALKDVSCIIIDEAHERSLYTDILLGILKKNVESRHDLRVIVTSATINPTIFVDYFKMAPESVIEVPGRSYPVDVIWWPEDVDKEWDYVNACVHKVYEIYSRQPDGDILVFLTSSSESEEAIYLFKKLLSSKNIKPQLLSLHGKSDIKEQMQVFQSHSQTSRKIVFATNVAETSVTIPGIKYVVDSGMTKDLKFNPKMNKSYLEVTFINKSAAEQRKGRAGRTQSGVCYRMYSKRNYAKDMADNVVPEVLKINLQKALLKIFELGINPKNFNFIEAPPERTMSNSIDSLEYLGAIKDGKLTELGRKIAKLPVEPQLAKLILQGIDAGIGYEIIVIAALVTESGKLFIRNEENRTLADEKKKQFFQIGGDLCTYLEIYKRWKEVFFHDRFKWCVDNYIHSKAMKIAANTVYEINMSLKTELGLCVPKRYNNSAFKKKYEKIIFDCFSENLCVSSGHPKLGYLSPYLPESFFIHPSSTLSHLGKDSPEFLVYRTVMETSRNFLFDITPISEETIKLATQSGNFQLPLHSLKCLQVPPKIMGPFGESVLVRHILGKQGSKIKDLESRIQHLTKVKNIYIDVTVDKGLITIYLPQIFHDQISKYINQIIEEVHTEILKEEDVIKLTNTSMHFALGAGGVINDIIMPGEFRELVFSHISPKEKSHLENILTNYGPLQSISHSKSKQETQIYVTYSKVCDAQKAFLDLKDKKMYDISSKLYLPNVSDNALPLYMLNVSWCRLPCTGSGSVEFFSHEDLIIASDILTRQSFTLDNKLLMFSPFTLKELKVKNLPQTVDEQTIRCKLRECLPEYIKVKDISVLRKKCNMDVQTAKEKLLKLFCCYVPIANLVIDIKHSENNIFWKACVYFECLKDAEIAFMKIKDNTNIDSYPLFVKQVFKSILYCKSDVYNAISKEVLCILEHKKKEGLCEDFSVKSHDGRRNLSVEFTSLNIQELNRIKHSLKHFLLGESLDLIGTDKYNFLFLDCYMKHIKEIQISTGTWIELNKCKKLITIYGSPNNCQEAKEKIYSNASKPDLLITRTFNLTASYFPAGFLKELYAKYGYDLRGLVNKFKLIAASVDNFGKRLILEGSKKEIKKAEESLEELCENLFQSRGERQKLSNQQEICPICFDPVTYDFLRLEHCGHAFCCQCLLFQLESKTVPVVCVKENCGKLVFLEDIKRIITIGGDHLRKDFCSVALRYHISCNNGKLSYCLTPDCQMIYRVTKQESEFNCPICKNSTCTRCHAPYHYGMSCEMFQNCQKDENYSLKTWVKEKESSRKYCPSCKAVIEKASGCNHIECLNCKVHLCWLCLRIFPTGPEVYVHMPYCPENQSN